MDKGLAKP